MKILVAASSKYGATAEIAGAIGGALEARGFQATVVEPEAAGDLGDLDAAVVGSAVYAGQWMKPALELVERLAAELPGRPVWLFSSGPLGDPPRPEGDPPVVAELMTKPGAAGHRVFAGRLDRNRLNFAEKAIVIALRAPAGDFRDWDAIAAWAGEIADALEGERGGR
jgi:menaquinone-dependent protoporphyrinogen oxidase